MELLQLKYFQVVARLEHMTRASEELNIAQPSLSKTISRLEEDLGVPLFDREGRQIKLNHYGKAFLRRVDRVFMEITEGKQELQSLSGLHQGTVQLAISIPSILPELVSSFLIEHSNVYFQQLIAGNSSMASLIERGDIHMGISSTPIEGTDIEWTPLLTEEVFLMVPNNHPLAKKKSIDLIEAKDESFISTNTGIGVRNVTDAYCREAGFIPKIAFEGDETLLIARLVQKGLGVAFVPALTWFISPHQSVSLLRIKNPVFQRTIGIARSKRRHASYAADCFFQHVVSYFEKISFKLEKHFT
ncbi:LysR family transcriptional regulator [Heyndrickxia acidicola]|uniref:LysR family transcriptional regulator n=1 Tax=Heyndrickxia acidicola TaxID=209389 RepID=A0ABU6MA04_9BACI|nr:LysR family transcriptional regulator [Heyndrickxia acidicola]MED1201505.1 LysR family transcriptional regulator [Heyndrickxia acidicola]